MDIDMVKERNGTHEKASIPLIESVREESIQPRASEGTAFSSPALPITRWTFIQNSSTTLPPWWSPGRDRALSEFWKSVNLLSGAMYAMVSKLVTIPFKIVPRDSTISSHMTIAKKFERRLYEGSEFGEGWTSFFSKQLEALLGQDNGRFMEVIDGSGNKAGPIVGAAISVAHLDPQRCQRTGDPDYPVIYHATDGSLRKLHWTRVSFSAQLPSEKVEMLGVGVSAISRCASYAQNMFDISVYKEEKLGSRPKRGLMLVGGGLDAEAVGEALAVTDGMSDARNLRRFSTLPIVGSPDIEDPSIDLVELSSLPDGFNEDETTSIAMAAIALGFGMDARELWPNIQKGATRADAILSHIKQRGKGPGQILAETERMFNTWYLPPFLQMVFDFQDDAQDRQRAEISRERSLKRKNDISMEITDDRTEREFMVAEGEMTTAQFSQLELNDGRLPNGKPIETLFFVDDPIYTEVLTIPGVSKPLDVLANEPESMLNKISTQKTIAYEVLARESSDTKMRKANESLAALESLERMYQEQMMAVQAEEALEEPASENRQGVREGPKSNPEDESAINARPDDEQNMSQSENDPRDLRKDDMFNKIISLTEGKGKKKAAQKQMLTLAKTIDEAMLTLAKMVDEAMEEPPPVINVQVDVPPANIEVNVPPSQVDVHIPEQQYPAPQITPNIDVHVPAPQIDVHMPHEKTVEKRVDNEHVELERDDFGQIIGLKRRKAK